MKSNILILISCIIFLTSCQSIKDGLSGKKSENSDEFLVEKKNPLELPPAYGDLPEPKAKTNNDLEDSIDEDIEKLIKGISENKKAKSSSGNKSAEDFVLREIKKD
tara:strand:+ start:113 stop:430 length:318 start_codon:yes stop_codon:yes gene_type:complete